MTAQAQGISTQGVSGGLVIPSAEVLDQGTVAFTAGNYSEPQLGSFARRHNLSMGIGLFPNIELFGRLADFQNPLPDSAVANGPRDISANVKVQVPQLWRDAPRMAVGLNDIGGGAVYFRSAYLVASDHYGPFKWSAGYALGKPITGNVANGYGFKGLFGGAEVFLGTPRLAAIAEHDGQTRHAGLRFYSAPLSWIGNGTVVGTLQRSFAAKDVGGRDQSRTAVAVSILVPLGGLNSTSKGQAEASTANPLPPLEDQARPLLSPTREDRLDSLQKALVVAGLERVRTGTYDKRLIIEYENHRFGVDEADALGVVLGLGAEYAPPGVTRVTAVVRKAGLRLYDVSVGVAEFRGFLRHGDARYASGSLAVDFESTYSVDHVDWGNPKPSRNTLIRVEVKPDLIYTVATDVGAFDYSIAANVQGIVPLWEGAEVYTSYVHRLANSENFDPSSIFGGSRQANGLKVVSLNQSFWLGSRVLAHLGAGRYNYSSLGLQGEATVFVPGRDDVVRLKAGQYQHQAGQPRSRATQLSGAYRWVHSPSTWVEAGVQQYSDGSRGPSIVLTRWFGDVAAHLSYRKGGARQFAGLELSIPLTPRRGMEPGLPFTFSGTPAFTTGVRTRLAGGSSAMNTVDTNAVRDFKPDYDGEQRYLNRGRVSEKFFIGQVGRMREAFFLYARDLLPK